MDFPYWTLLIFFIFSVLWLSEGIHQFLPVSSLSVHCVLSIVSCLCLLACFPRGLGGISQQMENTALRSMAEEHSLCCWYFIKTYETAVSHYLCQFLSWVCHSAFMWISETPAATAEGESWVLKRFNVFEAIHSSCLIFLSPIPAGVHRYDSLIFLSSGFVFLSSAHWQCSPYCFPASIF